MLFEFGIRLKLKKDAKALKMLNVFVVPQVVDTERSKTKETQRMAGNKKRKPGRVSILYLIDIEIQNPLAYNS